MWAYESTVSRAAVFRTGSSVALEIEGSRSSILTVMPDVCQKGGSSFITVMGYLSSGGWKESRRDVASFINEVFWMRDFGCQFSIILLFSFCFGSLVYLSYVSIVARFLRRSSGSVSVCISQALVGVVFIAPETNLRA